MTDPSHITRSGLPGVEWVPYGMHAYHSYSANDEVTAAHHCALERQHVSQFQAGGD